MGNRHFADADIDLTLHVNGCTRRLRRMRRASVSKAVR
jgi:hypothetical protein